AECHTPRRNRDVQCLVEAMNRLSTWGTGVVGHFMHSVFAKQQDHGLDLGSIDRGAKGVFIPVVPALESGAEGTDGSDTAPSPQSVHLSLGDVALMAEEQRKSLEEELVKIREVFAAGNQLVSAQEASLCMLVRSIQAIDEALELGVDLVESMLWQQVVSAIGKEVQPEDVAEYMKFHNRKLFATHVTPLPFLFNVRRGRGHAPEGAVSIEA
ncbi:unnamed protein product, partial [Discosporangium mesarthrocarpum]